MARQKSDWWFDFFPVFRPVLGNISSMVTNSEAAFIVRHMGLKSGMKFLDCPCGIGRISLQMARRGIRVTGVDVIGEYLDEVSIRAERLGLPIKVVESDMRRINFVDEYDGAASMQTSFGYFAKESDNLLVLKRLYRAVKPDGKVLVHTINRDWLIKNFMPRDWTDIKGIRISQSREIDFEKSILISRWYFLKKGVEREFVINLRIYSFHELLGMLESVGFKNIQGYGSTKDTPTGSNNRMMFVIGEKL